MNQSRTSNFVFPKKTGLTYFFAWYFSPPSRYYSASWAVAISAWKCINITAAKKPCKFEFYTYSNIKEWLIAYENKVLVDVILSNGIIDVWFAPFPDTALLSKKTAGFLPPPPPLLWSKQRIESGSKMRQMASESVSIFKRFPFL